MKVAISVVTNITAPYRTELFAALAPRVARLKVYFQEFVEQNRSWDRFPALPFPHEYLRPPGIRVGSRFIGWYGDVGSRLRDDAPDVVVGYGFSTAVAACAKYCRESGVPLVIANDGTLETDPSGGVEAAYRRALIRSASGFIAASTRAREYFIALGAPRECVSVVGLSRDLIAMRREVEARRASMGRQEGSKQEWRPSLCYPTRLVRDKRILEACEATLLASKKIPEIRLRIAGEGPLRHVIKSWIDRFAPGRIDLAGLLTWSEMVDLYATSDVLVFTGTRERFGMVILEALTAGLPVVAYNRSGAATDLVKENVNGYQVEEGDVVALADRIVRVLEAGERLEHLALGAATACEEHDVRRKAPLFLEAIKKALNRHPVLTGDGVEEPRE